MHYSSTNPELRAADTLSAAMLLALAGGSIDAFVYLNHGHVFAAVMTGNAILLGASVLQLDTLKALHNFVPIAAFLAGLFAARVLQGRAKRHYVLIGLACEIAGLFVASWLPGNFPDMAFVALVSFFSAYQVASFRKEDGTTYNSTFITSDLRTLTDGLYEALDPATRSEGLRKFRELGLVLLCFLAGAVAGAVLARRTGNHTLWFSDLALVAVLLRVFYRPRRPSVVEPKSHSNRRA